MVTLLRLHRDATTPIDVNMDLVRYIQRYNGAGSGSSLVFTSGENVHVIESMDYIYKYSGNLLLMDTHTTSQSPKPRRKRVS